MSALDQSVDAAGAASAAPSTPTVLEFEFGSYVGEVHADNAKLRHGVGRLEYHTGNTYDGQWADGAVHGSGVKTYANGDLYDGGWFQGKRHGGGTYTYDAGHVYAGEYENDYCHGLGQLKTMQGDKYDGKWRHGRKHGQGVEVMRDGQRFVGTWEHGKKEGMGELTPTGPGSVPIRGRWVQDKCVERLNDTPDVERLNDTPDVERLNETSPPGAAAATASSSATGATYRASPLGAPEALGQCNLARRGQQSQDGQEPPGATVHAFEGPLVNAKGAAAALSELGVDAGTIEAMGRFNSVVGRSMDGMVRGIDAIDSQLSALTGALEELDAAVAIEGSDATGSDQSDEVEEEEDPVTGRRPNDADL